MNNKKQIAIIGAGASGLMCADYLSDFDCEISIFEQMPSAGRKILWAGKTGLNLSHNEPIDTFISRYDSDNFTHLIKQYDCNWIINFCNELNIETFIGSTGRLFPTAMKGSPFLRAWLNKLNKKDVKFFYKHKCVNINNNAITFNNENGQFSQSFDAIILACGGLSYPKLGSTGEWVNWFNGSEISSMTASNVGICRKWSAYMMEYYGKPLKRVSAWVNDDNLTNHKKENGDIIISHYGFESGLIYKLNRVLKESLKKTGKLIVTLDLLPDIDDDKLLAKLTNPKKHSLNTLWQKAGLDKTKIALLRECVDKQYWHNGEQMAYLIKDLPIVFDDFRPLDEAISTAGGVRFDGLNDFQLKSNPNVFVCGEMLDFDAPTGGYLLTACFATGRGCGQNVAEVLNLIKR